MHLEQSTYYIILTQKTFKVMLFYYIIYLVENLTVCTFYSTLENLKIKYIFEIAFLMFIILIP